MKHLFSNEGIAALEKFCRRPTLFAFDFDGTLAGITRMPSKAHLRPRTRQLLTKLQKVAPVAVISGRGLVDLTPRVPKTFRYIAGNHGLERLKGKGKLIPARRISRGWVEQLSVPLKEFPGVRIEDKDFSLTVHFRNAEDGVRAVGDVRALCEGLTPLPRLITGKKVLNLIPSGSPHKGKALVDLMREAKVKRSFYIGDEPSDEDVFRLPKARVFSVRVGKKLRSHAKFYLRDQREIDRLLVLLLRISTEK